MAPRLILLMSTGSKKKPRYTCLSEAKASHSQRVWAEVSSSAPHLLHSGLSDSPIRWICLLMVLCPVRRPVTALDCVQLKDRNLALAPREGPKINSPACLWVSPIPCHHSKCWLTNQHLILLLISRLETPKVSSGPRNSITEPSLASLSVISLPHTRAYPGTQYNSECPGEILPSSPLLVLLNAHSVKWFNMIWKARDLFMAGAKIFVHCTMRRPSSGNYTVCTGDKGPMLPWNKVTKSRNSSSISIWGNGIESYHHIFKARCFRTILMC